ncbi:hypothetical protein T484DRAFT_1791869 [Baffinella frigidus]|nr:hypothetical protein T484DRAFT_1791869 [Cryptophyta sp. CCMP2293]
METHGQGGPCEDGGDWCYENGFMFVDANEAWVFETAGVSFWAAEQIAKGKTRNISNGLSIRKPTLLHKDLLATAQKDSILETTVLHKDLLATARREGWWDGKGDFDWKRVMLGNSSPSEELSPEGREQAGIDLLKKNTSKKAPPFGFEGMAAILRDTDSDICMRGAFESTGSQISVLTPGASGDEHWFTTSSDPSKSTTDPETAPA